MALELIQNGTGITTTASDIAATSIVTVPADGLWEPTLIRLDTTTSADAGTRINQLLVKDSTGTTLLVLNPTPTTAASLNRIFDIFPGAAASAAYVNTKYATWPFPPKFILPEGATIGWFDAAAIAPSADVVIVTLMYNAYVQVER